MYVVDCIVSTRLWIAQLGYERGNNVRLLAVSEERERAFEQERALLTNELQLMTGQSARAQADAAELRAVNESCACRGLLSGC